MAVENNEEIVTLDNHAPAPPVDGGATTQGDNHAPVPPAKDTATTQGDNHAPVPPAQG